MPPKIKFPEEQIEEICRLYKEGVKTVKLEEYFGINRKIISRCLKENNINVSKRIEINPGDKFGRWTVIDETNKKNDKRYFLCECSCINKTRKEVSLDNLKNGRGKSCGCLGEEKNSERLLGSGIDHTGKVFGRLTVLYEVERDKRGARQVMAQCSCDGNIKKYNLKSLVRGQTTSCGCYASERIKERFTYRVKDHQEKHPLFCKVEEIRDCEYEPGIEVRCKHSDCRKWFKPATNKLWVRIAAIETPNPKYPGIECNLYCSDKCKQDCDISGAQKTPKSLRNVVKQSRCSQRTNRKALLDLQIDECGYNYCEKCGKEFDASDLIIHHNIMVGVDHTMADDMSHQILICKEHHEHKGCY